MSNLAHMQPEVRAAFCHFRDNIDVALQVKIGSWNSRDRDLFLIRLERYFADFYEPFAHLYQNHSNFEKQLEKIGQLLLEQYAARPESLKKLDLEREITPDWFQRETMLGGIYYVDLFAGSLEGVRQHLPYLQELGLSYIHLMPLLTPRPGQNDGGYAVMDYFQVNPALGSIDDLEALAGELRANNMSLCIDLVVNHTAKEHEWAKRAMAGEKEFLDYYLTFDDRTMPDEYEKTLPEVFPDFAPGNFTYYPEMAGSGKWVWTTFNEFQWDLDYTNPAIFREMLNYMLYLSNKGIEILRLDAVPFMWKRLGTNCQNQPEVHHILQAFRALVRVVAPSVIFKAEAIVSPQDLISYLGTGKHTGKECKIAYNNSLMVLLWSTLASRKVALMTHTLRQMPPTPVGTTWITYIRLHDDIGWAVTDENAGAVGENGFLHRQFLNQFYSGHFPDSFSRGEVFQFNPATGDGRMSGMTASLAGLEKALADNDTAGIELALRRILLLYSVIFAYGGIPLIYMGDEIGLLNDYNYKQDPHKMNDNRWMHRPPMSWEIAEQRHDSTTIAGRIFLQMRSLIEARQRTPELHGAAIVTPLWTDNQHIFAFTREHPIYGRLLALGNFSEYPQAISTWWLNQNFSNKRLYDVSQSDKPSVTVENNQLLLQSYQYLWLVE